MVPLTRTLLFVSRIQFLHSILLNGNATMYVALLQAAKGDKGLLSLTDALNLVHLAHSVGLTTYFSAGFKAQHIKIAVYSGVDGIGTSRS
jgi:hypothetical protein